MRLANRLEDRGLALDRLLHVERAGIADQQVAVTGVLAVREQQHALFTKTIAAIARQHVHQIMRVAQAKSVELDEIVIGRAARLLRFFHQPGS